MHVLPVQDWTARRDRHRERVDGLIGPHLQRKATGRKHPVIDFLFTYYSFRPGALRRWHPGFGVGLAGPRAREYLRHPGYVEIDGVVTAAADVLASRRSTVEFVHTLLAATSARPMNLGCFGLHEWAMVYRTGDDEIRHDQVPLRLGHGGTDAVVESMQLRCTHYDALRFFTADAVPRNAHRLERANQVGSEQPGCLHAGMDLYKWCYKLVPLIDSDLLLECFEHAVAARELDMRASPYDLADLGYDPVRIEEPGGRAEYVRLQSALSWRGERLRSKLRDRCRVLLAYQEEEAVIPAGNIGCPQ
ncbi:3-methyladenine DNA glycosylase [Aldersonia sp. NBC_00410]|uniref:3-methyladenine DNA glycosylase n=1 Tax=Aldersonia sp. NBC_00410 TaxID=2975954 RepID=UPI0022589A91|nr:3-methyladenine DNA glycosylase [Aldersonia sp. NBC_00410]MCX5044367.1 3-methyladenine DNA glycosylase [Aldersonia sp. NBC_00410]